MIEFERTIDVWLSTNVCLLCSFHFFTSHDLVTPSVNSDERFEAWILRDVICSGDGDVKGKLGKVSNKQDLLLLDAHVSPSLCSIQVLYCIAIVREDPSGIKMCG